MSEFRRYVDWEYGQLHVRQWGERKSEKPPIFCLAPSPFSSVSFKTIAPMLATKHRLISMDYPGFGNSSPMPTWPTIEDYSEATKAVVDQISPGEPLVFLGFHSGTLVAIETALSVPDRADQLVLIDIPFFNEERRQSYLKDKGSKTLITADMAMLKPHWEMCVKSREKLIPITRAFENFVDLISSGERMNATYRAAFSYDCAKALSHVAVPTTFIATNAGLTEETKLAAETVTDAQLITLPEIDKAVLDYGAELVVKCVNEILEER